MPPVCDLPPLPALPPVLMPILTEASAPRLLAVVRSSAASRLSLPPASSVVLPADSMLVPLSVVSPLVLMRTLPPDWIEPPTSWTRDLSAVAPEALTLRLPPTTLWALTLTVNTAPASIFSERLLAVFCAAL